MGRRPRESQDVDPSIAELLSQCQQLYFIFLCAGKLRAYLFQPLLVGFSVVAKITPEHRKM